MPLDLIRSRVASLAAEAFPGKRHLVKEDSVLVGFGPEEAKEKYLEAVSKGRMLDYDIKSQGAM